MLGQRSRRWTNIDATMGQWLVFSVISPLSLIEWDRSERARDVANHGARYIRQFKSSWKNNTTGNPEQEQRKNREANGVWVGEQCLNDNKLIMHASPIMWLI